ncbi:MAG TPA: hypothetical protein VHD76_12570 [Bryobacteraceae bacterium]|nr:hypothetical protein [Bryobacteraceae bacterium]
MGSNIMEHSEYLAAAQMAVDYVKQQVKYRGLNTAGGWIRNPLDVPQKFGARIKSLNEGKQMDAQYRGKFDPQVYVDGLEKLAKDSNTGNCSELSSVAFNFLKRKGTRPLELYLVFRGSWDHAFVVLNRDGKAAVSDFSTWSYQAVVCDALYDRAADAGNLAIWYPRMFPMKAADLAWRLE